MQCKAQEVSAMMRFLKALLILGTLIPIIPAFIGEVQGAQGPDASLDRLMTGNQRFVSGKPTHPQQGVERRETLAQGQSPFAIILSCSDSRVPPEIIFDQGLGDLFIVRVAGNTFGDLELGSIEFAASVLKAPLIMVLGHDSCGAVKATMDGQPLPGHIGALAKRIGPDIKGKTCATDDKLRCAIEANVASLVKQLQESQPVLAPLIKEGKLKVVGARYNLKTGAVEKVE
jgi:carbonic anhydrase